MRSVRSNKDIEPRYLLWILPAALMLVSVPIPLGAEEPVLTAAESRRLLIDGEVLDAQTSEPVKTFRVIPGVRYNRLPGSRGSLAVWQPHMIREMNDGVFQWPRTRGYDEMRFRIEADGYRAATTTWLGKGGPHLRMKVHLRPDAGIEGVVLTPKGKLAQGAMLAVALPNRSIRLRGYEVEGHDQQPMSKLSDQWRQPPTIKTNEQGEFVLPYETDPSAVLCVVHETGYLEDSFLNWASVTDESNDTVMVQLEPWARIRGRVHWNDQPGRQETINFSVHRDTPYPGLIESFMSIQADDQGRFLFSHVPPGRVQISHVVTSNDEAPKRSSSGLEYPRENVLLKPGQTKRVIFGGDGMDVVGKLTGLQSYQDVTLSIRPPAPDVWNMKRFGGNAIVNEVQRGYEALQASSYAPLYFRESLPVSDDGSFRIKNVMTGQYNIWVQGATGSSEFQLTSSHKSPLDIGAIKVQPSPKPPQVIRPAIKGLDRLRN